MRYLLLAAAAVAVGLALAPGGGTQVARGEKGADAATFQKLIDEYGKLWTMTDGKIDLTKLDRFYAPGEGVIIFDFVPPGKSTSWAGHREALGRELFRHLKANRFVPRKDVTVRLVGDKAAVTTFTFDYENESKDGTKAKVTGRQTNVWERRGDKWLIVHEHGGPQPQRVGATPDKPSDRADAFGKGFTRHTRPLDDGMKVHYVTGGKGDPVLLLHGWPQTSHSWRKVAPALAAKGYTVVCPDLPGLGDSGRVKDTYSKRDAALHLRELMRQLGHKKILLVGTDWGAPVAYQYAANYPDEVRRVAIMECVFPGFGAEERTGIASPRPIWHFGFHMVPGLAEKALAGNERAYLTWFYDQAHNRAGITEADVDEYVRCYTAPGAMRSGFAYYRSIPQDRADNRKAAKAKLKMPALAVGGDRSLGDHLAEEALPKLAADVRGVVLKDCGHYLAEERPEELTRELLKFFAEAKRE